MDVASCGVGSCLVLHGVQELIAGNNMRGCRDQSPWVLFRRYAACPGPIGRVGAAATLVHLMRVCAGCHGCQASGTGDTWFT